ncbi:MAG: hypothetical protein E4H14_16085 [Candidatus Thorarchaeota archaeon]|nr:MAG: hypothetical protein E4H14_16085 [Candidatus Thorarchaeota archaeon]
MSSEDDNTRTDEYWMGVRDALRMVDSFHKWSTRNPGRAKSLDDFIHDGLIAAAKRCESCLSDKLGLSFTEDEDDEDEIILEDSIELDDKETADDAIDGDDIEDEIISEAYLGLEDEPEELEPAPSFEEPISSHDSASYISTFEELPISLDSVERRGDEEMEDLSIEGPPREFSTDFELVEPTPLIVDETSISEALVESEPEPEPEEFFSEPIIKEEPEIATEVEELPDKPSFTWTEYEEAVSPSSVPEPLDLEEDIFLSEDEGIHEEIEDDVNEEPPEPPKVWSPYDEPSIEDEEDSEDETEPEIAELEQIVEGEDEPVISEPPSLPPPPESEEDEEERKRRARRLFFGA